MPIVIQSSKHGNILEFLVDWAHLVIDLTATTKRGRELIAAYNERWLQAEQAGQFVPSTVPYTRYRDENGNVREVSQTVIGVYGPAIVREFTRLAYAKQSPYHSDFTKFIEKDKQEDEARGLGAFIHEINYDARYQSMAEAVLSDLVEDFLDAAASEQTQTLMTVPQLKRIVADKGYEVELRGLRVVVLHGDKVVASQPTAAKAYKAWRKATQENANV